MAIKLFSSNKTSPLTNYPATGSKLAGPFKFKICLLGDPCVGKTSLIRRFVFNDFSDEYLTTIGTKVSKKDIDLALTGERTTVTLLIWDIMGQKEFRNIQSLYFQDARGAIVVSDIMREETLGNVPDWITTLYKMSPRIPLILVMNKHDLVEESAIHGDDFMQMAEQYHAPYYYTSAKTGENVEVVFRMMARGILNRMAES